MRVLIVWLVCVNIAAFAACAADKRRARRGQWRVRERTLFLLAALGGSVGLLLGMNLFRHKTKHRSFTWGVPLILLCQLALAAFVYHMMGGELL